MNEIAENDLESLTLDQMKNKANLGATEIEYHGSSTIRVAIETGEVLQAIKEKLPYGEFSSWIEANFRHSHKHANRYMLIAKSTRVSNLNDFTSIRQALSMITNDPTKSDVEAERIDRIRTRLLSGEKRSSVAQSERVAAYRITEIWRDKVQPVLSARDWLSEVKESECQPIAAARLQHVISAQSGSTPWSEYAAAQLDISATYLQKAMQLVRNANASVIAAYEEGALAMPSAVEISRLPRDQQDSAVEQKATTLTDEMLDEMRRRTSQLVDQKIGFEQQYGNGPKPIREIAKRASVSGELADFIHYHKTVANWCATVATLLEEHDGCLQPTLEQKTTSLSKV